VLGGNYSYTKQVNSIQQLLAYSLITGTKVPEILGALYKKSKRPESKKRTKEQRKHHQDNGSTGLPSTLDEGTRKSQTLFESTATHPKDSRGNIQSLDRDLTSTTSGKGTAKTTLCLEGAGAKVLVGQTHLSLDLDVRAFLLSDDESKEDILRAGDEIDEEPQVAGIAETHHQSPTPQVDKPQSSHPPSTKASDTDSSSDNILKKYDNTLPLTERQLEKHEEAAVNYDDLKASVDDYYDENNAHRDQTDKLVEASMSFLNKSSNTISDLYKGLNIITELLKEIKNAIKDDSIINKKITKATKLMLSNKMKSYLPRLNHLLTWHGILAPDSQVLKGIKTISSLACSVTPTLALTHIPANVEGENATNTATEEPPSHTEGETREPKRVIPISTIQPTEVPPTQAQPITTIIPNPESSQAAPRSDKGKGIATESDEDSSKKLVPASTIVRPNPDEDVKVPYMINRKMCYLTDKEMQAYLDREEKFKKAAKEERLLAISKSEVIKVVQEEAEKIRLDPKKIASAKACEKFKKAQEAEHQVLKREHAEKVKKSLELKKHKFENYMWTINNRLKPETITDIKIHPKTKPLVITVYKGTNGRNFDFHKPFAFGAFGISELDELIEIIPKKKNTVVQDLMNSLSQRYERIRKIPKELGIKSALPAPAPEQASSKSSRKKRKHMELEPEVKIPGLECNRALPKNVPFVNNMVIEEPEYRIFFNDEFVASMVKSPENARFILKLKKLIAEHPDQEKLKSKKVKLEALRYEMN
ncbi:hypothetical protein Tco_0981189, partial [Tanacetum coccineum]